MDEPINSVTNQMCLDSPKLSRLTGNTETNQVFTSACARVGCGWGSCNVFRSRPHCICRQGWQGTRCEQRMGKSG